MENDVFELVNPQSESPLVLTCEHASAKIPPEYQNLGLAEKELNRHIARDKGVREVTLNLAQKLGCFAILGGYSRLLIDLNRGEDESELVVEESDKTLVPANQNLSPEEKSRRIEKFYRPYYAALRAHLQKLEQLGKKPILFSVHSFTPQLRGGSFRPWNAGILYHQPQKLASYLLADLQNRTSKKLGENVPYDLRKYNTGAAVFCGENLGYDYALIEIRDSEFDDLNAGAQTWTELLFPPLQQYIQQK